MSRRQIPWEEIRAAYGEGATRKARIQRYGVPYSTLSNHIRAEGWTVSPEETLSDKISADPLAPKKAPARRRSPGKTVLPRLRQAARRLQQTAAVLLSAAENGDEVSIRDVKELAALLRELTALAHSIESSQPEPVRVVLEPPLDEWAM